MKQLKYLEGLGFLAAVENQNHQPENEHDCITAAVKQISGMDAKVKGYAEFLKGYRPQATMEVAYEYAMNHIALDKLKKQLDDLRKSFNRFIIITSAVFGFASGGLLALIII